MQSLGIVLNFILRALRIPWRNQGSERIKSASQICSVKNGWKKDKNTFEGMNEATAFSIVRLGDGALEQGGGGEQADGFKIYLKVK